VGKKPRGHLHRKNSCKFRERCHFSHNPASAEVVFFEQLVLPFGSSASVGWFNWVARALRTILTRLFLVNVTHYYDDFSVVEVGTAEALRIVAVMVQPFLNLE
jgi:cytochrome b